MTTAVEHYRCTGTGITIDINFDIDSGCADGP